MKISIILFMLTITVLQLSCKNDLNNREKIKTTFRFPDSMFTIDTDIQNYYSFQMFYSKYNNTAFSETNYLKYNENDDIEIKYVKNLKNILLVVRKFKQGYKSCLIEWPNLPYDLTNLQDSIIYKSNLNTKTIGQVIKSYNGNCIYVSYKKIVIDYSKEIRNMEFFYNIKFVE